MGKSLNTSTQMHIILDLLKVNSQNPNKGNGITKKCTTFATNYYYTR